MQPKVSVASCAGYIIRFVRKTTALTSSWQIDLPGHAEAIIEPAESPAEAIIVEGHQPVPVFGQDLGDAVDFFRAGAGDEERIGRREGKWMLHPAVAAEDGLPGQGERRHDDRPFGSRAFR